MRNILIFNNPHAGRKVSTNPIDYLTEQIQKRGDNYEVVNEDPSKLSDLPEVAGNQADLAIVIGVRPNIDDKHIWDVLAKMEGDIALVGNEEECKDWLAKHRNIENDKWLGNRFQTSYEKVVQLIND